MPAPLAVHGGTPVRPTLLPYGRQCVDGDDVAAVDAILRSDWLTTGPKVEEFEKAFAAFTGTQHAVAVSNGTAALHTAVQALGIGEGDEVIVPTMTFAATVNAVLFQGGTPVFVDSSPDTLCIDPKQVERALTPRTKAVIAMDYGGQPCDYAALRAIADKRKLPILADACHALGGMLDGRPVGSLADLSTFSFHPVKPMTTGEGGMVTTDDAALAQRMRRFRNHCLTTDHRERHEKGSYAYEVQELGYNYRLTDFQCALGLSQLKKVPAWTERRQRIASLYSESFAGMDTLHPLAVRKGLIHAYHLYVILLNPETLTASRDEIFKALRAENIGVNVHYIPVHLHPYYRKRFGTKEGMYPVAEEAFEKMITLPLFAGMNDVDAQDVITAVNKTTAFYAR
ncbi:MAG: UDP-4-amino-4,6-dideoxy-N-acetyl-beta-L-altrosamine transaminase [Candidatus Peribacteraceae bacterium]